MWKVLLRKRVREDEGEGVYQCCLFGFPMAWGVREPFLGRGGYRACEDLGLIDGKFGEAILSAADSEMTRATTNFGVYSTIRGWFTSLSHKVH